MHVQKQLENLAKKGRLYNLSSKVLLIGHVFCTAGLHIGIQYQKPLSEILRARNHLQQLNTVMFCQFSLGELVGS